MQMHHPVLTSRVYMGESRNNTALHLHDGVIKWKHFPRYWPFVRRIHRSPVNSPHKGQWRGALMFSLICTRINGWVNNREAGDLRRHRALYDITVMCTRAVCVTPCILIKSNFSYASRAPDPRLVKCLTASCWDTLGLDWTRRDKIRIGPSLIVSLTVFRVWSPVLTRVFLSCEWAIFT